MKKINTIFSQIKLVIKKILFKNYLENPENILLYICGNEALPDPLSAEEELALLEEVSMNNEVAIVVLNIEKRNMVNIIIPLRFRRGGREAASQGK